MARVVNTCSKIVMSLSLSQYSVFIFQTKIMKHVNGNETSLFSKEFEPKVLAAISADIAYFPFVKSETQGNILFFSLNLLCVNL